MSVLIKSALLPWEQISESVLFSITLKRGLVVLQSFMISW